MALDGGGIRGVVTARILQDVQEQIGKPLNQYFDLIAGTSTGSILAASIVLGKEPQELIEIYKERGQEIFNASWLQKNLPFTTYIRGSKYSNEGLIKVLKEYLCHEKFGEITLCQVSEISKAELLILAYDTLYRNTTFFTSRCPEKNRWFNNVKLWEVCVSSASAPTFFPPYEFKWTDPNDPQKTEWKFPHIDGGVSANCPALAALSHVIKVKNIDIEDIAILSIGTGRTTHPLEYKEINNWGTVLWGLNVVDVFMGGQIQMATDLCQEILQRVNPDSYQRLQFNLNERFGKRTNEYSSCKLLPVEEQKNQYINKKINEAMDDASKENIQNLLDATEAFVNSKSEVIKKFIKNNDPILQEPQLAT